MASLEAQINQYTSEIEKTTAKIDDLRSQKRQLEDAEKKKELEQDIQALLSERDKLLDRRMVLEDKLLGTFGHISIHAHS